MTVNELLQDELHRLSKEGRCMFCCNGVPCGEIGYDYMVDLSLDKTARRDFWWCKLHWEQTERLRGGGSGERM